MRAIKAPEGPVRADDGREHIAALRALGTWPGRRANRRVESPAGALATKARRLWVLKCKPGQFLSLALQPSSPFSGAGGRGADCTCDTRPCAGIRTDRFYLPFPHTHMTIKAAGTTSLLLFIHIVLTPPIYICV